jgi:hypothetical protein
MSQVEWFREFLYAQVNWFPLSEQWRLQYSSAYLIQQSCNWSRRAVRFVRLAQKVVKQNDGDFVDVILLYISLYSRCYCHRTLLIMRERQSVRVRITCCSTVCLFLSVILYRAVVSTVVRLYVFRTSAIIKGGWWISHPRCLHSSWSLQLLIEWEIERDVGPVWILWRREIYLPCWESNPDSLVTHAVDWLVHPGSNLAWQLISRSDGELYP